MKCTGRQLFAYTVSYIDQEFSENKTMACLLENATEYKQHLLTIVKNCFSDIVKLDGINTSDLPFATLARCKPHTVQKISWTFFNLPPNELYHSVFFIASLGIEMPMIFLDTAIIAFSGSLGKIEGACMQSKCTILCEAISRKSFSMCEYHMRDEREAK